MARQGVQPADLSDGELVSRARAGVAPAFAELVCRYQDRIYNVCYRMTSHHADALDLTQATFLKALESLTQFEGRATFFTWLFRIAFNFALTHRRTQRRRATTSVDVSAMDIARPSLRLVRGDDESSPSTRVEIEEEHARVMRALSELEDDFRSAVILKDVEDLDYATIAEILEVPIGTVKSRIHRGRSVLREKLLDARKHLGA